MNRKSKDIMVIADEFGGTTVAAALSEGENGGIASADAVFGGGKSIATLSSMIPGSTLSSEIILTKFGNYEGVAVTTFLGAPQVRHMIYIIFV